MSSLQDIYNQVNAFRTDPIPYGPICNPPPMVLVNLTIEKDLESAALWQASHRCQPVSHTTCPEWCFMFDNKCDHISRIKHFTFPLQTENEAELLVMGPKRPFKHLVHKEGHCRQLLDPAINSMGAAIVGNLFILTLAWYHRARGDA